MKTQVIYVSGTGNTEKLAETIYQEIPFSQKDIKKLDSCYETCFADLYFIGFWTNRGTANVEVLDYLSELHGKRIALFGTCGMGNTPDYYWQIEQNVSAFLPDDSTYLGSFFCQGKMPMRIRKKYEQMLHADNQQQIKRLLQNFDEGLLHPDKRDLEAARQFVQNICAKQINRW